MAILWKKEYSIGLSAIDEQHKIFVEILNKLSRSFLKPDDRKTVAKTLKELSSYAKEHFASEEKYFDVFHYEHTTQHKRGHAAFQQQIRLLENQFNEGRDLLEYDLLEFMNDWLIVHIMEEDKKYIECFKKNGIK